MAKEAVFTMKLEAELRDEFMAEAAAVHRPASQVLRELMREFVRRQREARERDDSLRASIDAGRASAAR
jgi:predicted transcriptional regulator